MSNDIVTLSFNVQGRNPVEISPAWSYVAWRYNAIGVGKFYMPYADAKCTEDIIGIGNRILLRFGNGLPLFGGVIDVPRRRLEHGVECTVYTGHRILSWRHTPKTAAYVSQTPGTIARQVLLAENAENDTGIAIGSVWEHGTARSETYHYNYVLSLLTKLQGQSGEDYDIQPVYSETAGTLTFRLNWYQRIGMDKTSDGVALVQGHNVQGAPIVDEQGPIAGNITLVEGPSSGNSWNDKLISIEQDADSLNEFGYRESAKIMADIADQDTLDASSATYIDNVKDVTRKYTIFALDKDPSGFSAYTVGDDVLLTAWQNIPGWALDMQAIRILGRDWRPDEPCRMEAVDA